MLILMGNPGRRKARCRGILRFGILAAVLLGASSALIPVPLAAQTTAGFFDHFDAAALDPRWTPILAGNGALALSNSVVECQSPQPADACAFYFNTKIDKTKSQLWVFAISNQNGTFPQPWISVFDSVTAPGAGSSANLNPGLRARIGTLRVGTTGGIAFDYWDTLHSNKEWDGVNNRWVSPAVLADSPIAGDDYYLVGFEVDGVNNRWRMMAWAKRSASAGTFTFAQGLRLFALSDWVSWSSLEASNDLWLVVGEPYIDANAGTLRVEWARQDAGAKEEVWTNGKSTIGDHYSIQHGWGYDSLNGGVEVMVPEGRGTPALDVGPSGSWDSQNVKDPFAFYDPATKTYFLLYSGNGGSPTVYQVGLASSPTPNGPFSKFSGNPILHSVPNTGESLVINPSIVKDTAEPDPNKLFKLLYTGFSANQYRIFLASAPAITGPWTKQGMVLDLGPAGAFDQDGISRPRPVFQNGVWYVFLSARTNSDVGFPFRVTYASGPQLNQLTRSGVILVDSRVGPAQDITAMLSGRIVAVKSTAGFVSDAYVEIDQDTDANSYGQSRIRKILSPTTLELYHGLDGFATTTPAKLAQLDGATRVEIADIRQVGAMWYMYVTPFAFFVPFSNLTAQDENTGLLTSSSLTGPYTWNFLATPPYARSAWRNQVSNENITFVHLPTNVDTTLPSVPTNLTANPVSDSEIDLNWSASTDNVGVTGYQIFRGSVQIAASTLVSYADTGLSPSTPYIYSVTAFDAAGNLSSPCIPLQANTLADTTPPAISAVSVSSVTNSSAVVSWLTNERSTSQLEYGLDTGYGFATNLDTTLVTTHSQTLAGLASNTLYHFRVDSTDAAGNPAVSADFTFVTPFVDLIPPSVSMVSPQDSSTVSGIVVVSASAMDNVGVIGVQFKLDGVNLGTEVATAPYSVPWDTTTAANAAHTLAAVARDLAGNMATAIPVAVTVYNNRAIKWNGVNGVLIGPTSGPPVQFSLSLWINPASMGQNNSGHIFCIRDNSTNNPNLQLRLLAGNSVRFFASFDNAGALTFGYWDTPSNSVALNHWQHIAVTYDGSSPANQPIIYINGVAQILTQGSVPVGTLRTNAAPWRIGNNPSLAATFNGVIDEVRFYNRLLTPAEVIGHYNGGTTVPGNPDPGLIAGWHFDEGSGFVANDYSGNGNTMKLSIGPVWVPH